VQNELEECQSRQSRAPMGLRSAYPTGAAPRRSGLRSGECIIGAPVGIEELSSQTEERG